jgi:hypothetical protein
MLNVSAEGTTMIAETIDKDLGPNAEAIQQSFVIAWKGPGASDVILGLAWAYEDCDNNYAKEEAYALWGLTGYLL